MSYDLEKSLPKSVVTGPMVPHHEISITHSSENFDRRHHSCDIMQPHIPWDNDQDKLKIESMITHFLCARKLQLGVLHTCSD